MARRDVYAASIVDYLSRHEGWSKAVEIARGADVPKGSMYGLMATLVESGSVEGRPSDQGGGYKLRAHSDEGEESAKTAPDGAAEPCEKPDKNLVAKVTPDVAPDLIPPAPAPVKPPPEQPANVAPASESLPPQARLAPFAGLTWVDPDDETEALEICVLQLGRLAGPARDRVMTYLASRFMDEW